MSVQLTQDDISLLMEALTALGEKTEVSLLAEETKGDPPKSISDMVMRIMMHKRSTLLTPQHERIILVQAKLIQLRDQIDVDTYLEGGDEL